MNEEISPLQDHASKAEINVADLSRKDHKLMRVIEQVRNERARKGSGGASSSVSTTTPSSVQGSQVPSPTSSSGSRSASFADVVAKLKSLRLSSEGSDGGGTGLKENCSKSVDQKSSSLHTNRSLLPSFVPCTHHSF